MFEDLSETLRLIRKTSNTLIKLEIIVDVLADENPALRYCPDTSLNGDSNILAEPTLEALNGMTARGG